MKEITNFVLRQMESGSIELFHNAAEQTPEALPGILWALRKECFKVTPI